MKKLYSTLAFLALACAAQAQSQRLVLIEEFTQASCGPCAAANPTFNNLLNANTTKAVSLKYQVSWPGVDPMNAQYPTISGRANYYSVTGVPYAVMDGVAPTGASYTGYPNNISQSDINSEYGIYSPFSLDVQHTLNAAQDSVFITVHATATQTYNCATSTYLRLHTALIEKHIHFATAPGSNGETDFENVVRKMIPGTSGKALANNWVPGQDTTFSYAVPVPTYIYDINELAVVCFIEDNTTKQVQQAAFSISPLGVHTPENAVAALNIFPNPASGISNIHFSLASESDVTINVFNATGALVSSEKKGKLGAGKQQASIDVESLANGIYMVELITAESKSTARLNVQH